MTVFRFLTSFGQHATWWRWSLAVSISSATVACGKVGYELEPLDVADGGPATCMGSCSCLNDVTSIECMGDCIVDCPSGRCTMRCPARAVCELKCGATSLKCQSGATSCTRRCAEKP